MTRAYNFSAGPAAIPEAVLKRVQSELMDFQGLGVSVMEISHRGTDFIEKVFMPAKENLKKLLNIPENYHILFTSAGTSHQFSMVPLNLLREKNKADYFYTGIWSGKAIKEAQRYGKINIAVNAEKNCFTQIDAPAEWLLDPESAYVHYTPNETINGLQLHDIPETGEVPLVADMSSEILSRTRDVSRYGLIYAGAQKNIGPSGLAIVIIREDLAGHAKSFTPVLYNYQTYVSTDSLYHTPNTFGIYMAGCVFEWLLNLGGLSVMEKINQQKAQKLYHIIDNSDFYQNKIHPDDRSMSNIIYNLPTPELDSLFIQKAAENNLINLKGHKAVGGIRASIYNAMPEKGVDLLSDFMKDFEKQYG